MSATPPITEAEWAILSRVVALLRRHPQPRRIILEPKRGGRYVDVLAETAIGDEMTAASCEGS